MIGRNIGEYLKKLRLENELTLEKVSYDTRIKRELLDAIEKSDFSQFSSHVHAKGFIKNYASYLGVEAAGLLAIYKRDYELKNEKRKLEILPARNAQHNFTSGNSKIKEEQPQKKKFYEILQGFNIRNNVFGRISLLLILLILVLFLPSLYSKILQVPQKVYHLP